MKAKHYITIITITLIALFFFTGMEKIWHHKSFVIQLGRQPLPEWMKGLLEWGLPVVELAAVVLLVVGQSRLLGLWVSAIMMLAFAGYTAYAATEPQGFVPCACGKIFNTLSWGQHFWLNMAFFGMAVMGILFYYQHRKHIHMVDSHKLEASNNIAQSPG